MLQNGLEEGFSQYMNERQCELCKEFWPSDWEFYRHDRTPWCIACEVEKKQFGDAPKKRRVRSEEYMAKQRARAREQWKTRVLTPEQRERKREYDRMRQAQRKALLRAK